jgi:hypothetical protein
VGTFNACVVFNSAQQSWLKLVAHALMASLLAVEIAAAVSVARYRLPSGLTRQRKPEELLDSPQSRFLQWLCRLPLL